MTGNGPSLRILNSWPHEKVRRRTCSLTASLTWAFLLSANKHVSEHGRSVHSSPSGTDTQWRPVVYRKIGHLYQQGRGPFQLSNSSQPTITYSEVLQQFCETQSMFLPGGLVPAGRLPVSRPGNLLATITSYMAKMSAIPTSLRTGTHRDIPERLSVPRVAPTQNGHGWLGLLSLFQHWKLLFDQTDGTIQFPSRAGPFQ